MTHLVRAIAIVVSGTMWACLPYSVRSTVGPLPSGLTQSVFASPAEKVLVLPLWVDTAEDGDRYFLGRPALVAGGDLSDLPEHLHAYRNSGWMDAAGHSGSWKSVVSLTLLTEGGQLAWMQYTMSSHREDIHWVNLHVATLSPTWKSELQAVVDTMEGFRSGATGDNSALWRVPECLKAREAYDMNEGGLGTGEFDVVWICPGAFPVEVRRGGWARQAVAAFLAVVPAEDSVGGRWTPIEPSRRGP